jgi:hypothetical protein
MALTMGLSWVPGAMADLSNGLVAYYPFNGNVNDESGNGNHGTVVGATLTDDRFGNLKSAYSFDGADDFIAIQDNNSLDLTNEITIGLWVKPRVLPSNYHNIISKGDPPRHNNNAPWQVTIDGNGNLGVYRLKDDNYSSERNVYVLPINQWTYITLKFEIGTEKVSVYKNAILVRQWNKSNSIFVDEVDITIGAQTWDGVIAPGYFFNGVIDELRIYNRALSESEIQQLYQMGNQPSDNCWAIYKNGNLHIPCVKVIGPFGDELQYEADMP